MTRHADELQQLGEDFLKWGRIYFFVKDETARIRGERAAKKGRRGEGGPQGEAILTAAAKFGYEQRGIEKILTRFSSWEPALTKAREAFDARWPENTFDAGYSFLVPLTPAELRDREFVHQCLDSNCPSPLMALQAQNRKKVTAQK